jgi:hypothetical protein
MGNHNMGCRSIRTNYPATHQNLSSGVYIVKIYTTAGELSKKIIIPYKNEIKLKKLPWAVLFKVKNFKKKKAILFSR